MGQELAACPHGLKASDEVLGPGGEAVGEVASGGVVAVGELVGQGAQGASGYAIRLVFVDELATVRIAQNPDVVVFDLRRDRPG